MNTTDPPALGASSRALPLAAGLAGILFGAAIVVTRYVLPQSSPAGLAFHRYLLASLLLLPALLKFGRPPIAELVRILLLGGLVFGTFPLLLNVGIQQTSASRGAVVVALIPAMTLLLSVALGRERLSAKKAVGTVLAVSGVAIVEFGGGGWGGAGTLWGELALLGSAASVAVFNVLSPPLVRRVGPLKLVAWGIPAGACVALPFALANPSFRLWPALDAGGWLALLFLAGLATALAMYLWSLALGGLTPARVAIVLSLNPVTAALLGALWLAEPLGDGFVAGLVLVLCGTALVVSGQGTRTPITLSLRREG